MTALPNSYQRETLLLKLDDQAKVRWRIIINFATFCSVALHSSRPLLSVLNLRKTRVSVLPEGEEFLASLFGSFLSTLLLPMAAIEEL
jgi:hypothetical protein